jgi:hypothetical protein
MLLILLANPAFCIGTSSLHAVSLLILVTDEAVLDFASRIMLFIRGKCG